IELGRIPASAAAKRRLDRRLVREALLAGGDDYELVFTAARSRRARIERIGRRLGLRLTRIGAIVPPRRGRPPVTVFGTGGKPLAIRRTGYDHFG
ncbi:MAG TPA: thiamine-phosphate kinase, partial [Burkholderiales bacterium]|nr:thiamine-phosphate kinase [Burkholderiales bacterium]